MTGDQCSNCGEAFGYDIGWDDPPKGDGHIEVAWNPADEPSFVVGETRRYCSPKCLEQEVDDLPFSSSCDCNERAVDTGIERGESADGE